RPGIARQHVLVHESLGVELPEDEPGLLAIKTDKAEVLVMLAALVGSVVGHGRGLEITFIHDECDGELDSPSTGLAFARPFPRPAERSRRVRVVGLGNRLRRLRLVRAAGANRSHEKAGRRYKHCGCASHVNASP